MSPLPARVLPKDGQKDRDGGALQATGDKQTSRPCTQAGAIIRSHYTTITDRVMIARRRHRPAAGAVISQTTSRDAETITVTETNRSAATGVPMSLLNNRRWRQTELALYGWTKLSTKFQTAASLSLDWFCDNSIDVQCDIRPKCYEKILKTLQTRFIEKLWKEYKCTCPFIYVLLCSSVISISITSLCMCFVLLDYY